MTRDVRSRVRTLGYQPALDGLRGVAVTAVLVYHLGGRARSTVAHGGFLGVDVFFVLSGYLITTLLLDERFATGSIRLGRFWARRARRLLPGIVVLLVLIALLARFAYPDALRALVRDDVLYVLTYSQNWHLSVWHGSGSSPLGPIWSLSVEEQFYFLWPIAVGLIVAMTGRNRRRLFAVMVVLFVAGGFWTAARFADGGTLVYFATDTRAVDLFAGAALAALGIGTTLILGERTRRRLDGIAVVLLVAVLVTLASAQLESAWFAGGFVVLSVAVASVIAAAVQPTGVVRTVLAVPPLVAVGKISYGLYLFHFPVYAWVGQWDQGPVVRHLAGMLIAGVLATASYFAIEMPVRRRRWPAKTVVAAGALVATAALVVIITTTIAPQPSSPLLAFALGTARAEAPDGVPRVLVVGGARAASLMVGHHKAVRTGDMYALSIGTPGCGVLSTATACRRVSDDLDALAGTFDSDALVLALEEADLSVYAKTHRDPGHRLDALADEVPGRRLVVLRLPCNAAPVELRQRFDAAVTRWGARRKVRVAASPYVACPTGRPAVASQPDAAWNALGRIAGSRR
jgi:peptidoglycan/LPS O-acetylase OafA/YrhL